MRFKPKKLDPIRKRLQMNNLYKNNAKYKFEKHLNSKSCIQGWRNKFIKNIIFYENIYFLDLGSGLGDKSQKIINSFGSKVKEGYLIDFSESAAKNAKIFLNRNSTKLSIFNLDALKGIEKLENESVNFIIMFGFLHELADRKTLLKKLKAKLKANYVLLISDNCLYFKAEELYQDLYEIGYRGIVHKKLISIFGLHIFKLISPNRVFRKFKFIWNRGNMDTFIGYFSSDVLLIEDNYLT